MNRLRQLILNRVAQRDLIRPCDLSGPTRKFFQFQLVCQRLWQGATRREWQRPLKEARSRALPAPMQVTQSMDADRPTRRALPWCPAAALQCLQRTLPFTAHSALHPNTTEALNMK